MSASGAQAVIDVVSVIGDIVGERSDLRLHARETPQLQVLLPDILPDGLGNAMRAITAQRLSVLVGERPIVFDQAFQRFPGEVEPVEARVMPLKRRHDP
jgi:hypothetical protein